MRVVPFDPIDMEIALPSEVLRDFEHDYRPRGPAFTGIDDKGAVLGAVGVVTDTDPPLAWAVLTDKTAPLCRAVWVFRQIRQWLRSGHGLSRIEAFVRDDWPNGQNWAGALGFRYVDTVENYEHTGESYARFRWEHGT